VITVLFGPPGSGKGTQADIICAQLGVPHISTGAMFRAEIAAKTELGKEVEPILAAGMLVPDDLTVRILEARLAQPDAAGGVWLDGFPRTVPQAEALERMLAAHGRRVGVVINLDVADSELRTRIAQRAHEQGRDDDTEEAFAKRMEVYRGQTAPVLEYYRNSTVRVEDVDGVGSIDEITRRILDAGLEMSA
jgi:adenylate kinase